MIVLIIGVCGSGKTTIGHALARKTSWAFEDADNFHSSANISKMKQGIPLSDEDRIPWLLSLHKVVESWKRSSCSGVLVCSALKASYRNIIFYGPSNKQRKKEEASQNGLPEHLIVLLQGSKELIQKRLAERSGHFMPSSLLDSQLAILQPLDQESLNSITLSIDNTIENIIHEIVQKIEDVT